MMELNDFLENFRIKNIVDLENAKKCFIDRSSETCVVDGIAYQLKFTEEDNVEVRWCIRKSADSQSVQYNVNSMSICVYDCVVAYIRAIETSLEGEESLTQDEERVYDDFKRALIVVCVKRNILSYEYDSANTLVNIYGHMLSIPDVENMLVEVYSKYGQIISNYSSLKKGITLIHSSSALRAKMCKLKHRKLFERIGID